MKFTYTSLFHRSFNGLTGAQQEQITEAIARFLSEGNRTNGNPFAEYEALCDQGNDIAQDFIDCLWEYPLAFQRMVVYKYREAIIDIFAGRLYGEIGDSNPARIAMHKLLAPKNEVNQEATTGSMLQSAA